MDRVVIELSSAVDISNAIGILDYDIELLKKSVQEGVSFGDVSGTKRLLEALQSELYNELREYKGYGEILKGRTLIMQNGNIIEASD